MCYAFIDGSTIKRFLPSFYVVMTVTRKKRLRSGPTAPNVIQTVDIGACDGECQLKQARKDHRWAEKWKKTDEWTHHGNHLDSMLKPFRRRVVVDPKLNEDAIYYRHRRGRETAAELKEAGVEVVGEELSEYIDHMKREGLKARSFNLDMPIPDTSDYGDESVVTMYGLDTLFSEAANVLVPNGKIFVTSEHKKTLQKIIDEAKKHGLRVRRRYDRDSRKRTEILSLPRFYDQDTKNGDEDSKQRLRTPWMRNVADPADGAKEKSREDTHIYRIEITYGLKKARKRQ